MCGHAHHDDMLYLGKEAVPGWEYPRLGDGAYADRELYEYWATKDPIATYAARLEAAGVIERGTLDTLKRDAEALVEAEAQVVIAAPWPEPAAAASAVFANEPPRARSEVLDPAQRLDVDLRSPLPPVEPGIPFNKQGRTFLEAVAMGIED